VTVGTRFGARDALLRDQLYAHGRDALPRDPTLHVSNGKAPSKR